MFNLSKKVCLIQFRQPIKLIKKNYEKFTYQNVNRLLSTNLNCKEENINSNLRY